MNFLHAFDSRCETQFVVEAEGYCNNFSRPSSSGPIKQFDLSLYIIQCYADSGRRIG